MNDRVVVRLDKIYTRGGDDGQTSLGEGSRVSKSSLRVGALGDVDETSAALGLALAEAGGTDFGTDLRVVQNDLFDLGADLCVPSTSPASGKRHRIRVHAERVAWLEGRIDHYNEALPPLTSFVLPGGSILAAKLHVARTVARRAERSVVGLAGCEEVSPTVRQYLNRLSDLLFVLSRIANGNGTDDVLWRPQGAGRRG